MPQYGASSGFVHDFLNYVQITYYVKINTEGLTVQKMR